MTEMSQNVVMDGEYRPCWSKCLWNCTLREDDRVVMFHIRKYYPQNVEVVSLVLISKFYFQTFSTRGVLVDVGLVKSC